MTTVLLRLPGPSIVPEMMTGDRVLDDYLVDLDDRLLGGARVRALTVAELRDHLIERRDSLVAEGVAAAEASRIAVSALGPAADHAAAQRRALRQRFVALASSSALSLAFMMLLIEATRGGGLRARSLVVAGVQGVFFGLVLGVVMVYLQPPRALPKVEAGPADGPFVVGYPAAMRWLGYAMALVFVLGIVAGASAALGVELLEFVGFGRLEGALMIVLGLQATRGVLLGDLRYEVQRDGYWVRRWYGRRWVPWSAVRRVRPLHEVRRWIPRWSYWSNVRLIEETGPRGGVVRTPIYADVPGADRFARLVERKAVGAGRPIA